MVKTVAREIRRLLHPRSISVLKMEGKPVDQAFVHGIAVYFITYMGIIAASILLISLDGKDMVTTSTSIIACMNNIGPGLGMVGPSGNYADFSAFSKIVLSLDMLLGRLEIFPIFMLFSPAVWRRS
jgi:trk system potassium uptake protein TrkH